MKTYQRLSNLIMARENCIKAGNLEWAKKHEEAIHVILSHFPSGSGFDTGTKIDLTRSTPEKLVFGVSFHHMNENGMYDGWTAHTVTVKASLLYGVMFVISGRNRDNIKDHITEIFSDVLEEEVE